MKRKNIKVINSRKTKQTASTLYPNNSHLTKIIVTLELINTHWRLITHTRKIYLKRVMIEAR